MPADPPASRAPAMLSRSCFTICLVALALASLAPGAAPPRPGVSFERDIHPLLAARCLRCHQGSNPTSGVRLDVRGELLGESNGKPLVSLGKEADQSRLIQVVSG